MENFIGIRGKFPEEKNNVNSTGETKGNWKIPIRSASPMGVGFYCVPGQDPSSYKYL